MKKTVLLLAFLLLPAVCRAEVKQKTYSITIKAHWVDLSWLPPPTGQVERYHVYRSLYSGGPYSRIDLTVVRDTSFKDDGVLAGKMYYYVVTAEDLDGNESGYSNEAPATVPTD
jgi:fibronectin type 3 domain-containing protein